ncbi:hypothetical protein T03_11122 [Trichinella britovi]|uniref:Uncharacterized protein n=1 Tax=Trichinella britovi TaxID=45882 RepID=A0A0V1CEV9_TRIBR|nr:hypothetical protein T03_11122 [Trichinella britovi]
MLCKSRIFDDHHMEDDKKQVKSNEGIEESDQIAQAVQIITDENANNVIEIESELSITGSAQYSKRDKEIEGYSETAVINKDIVIVPMCEVSSDGSGEPLKRNEATKQYNDINPNGILAHICLELTSEMEIMLYCYAIGTLQYCLSKEAVELGRDF